MIILDTDHLSILDEDSILGFTLGRRLSGIPDNTVFITVITYEEQMRGWLSYVAQASSIRHQVDAYAKLQRHIDKFRRMPSLDFDEKSASIYEDLRRARVRIGSMDLKIASIALANNALLLSRNISHFGKVPGLLVEDWTL